MAITDDYLPLPVPESLSATYLVPVSKPPGICCAQAVAALSGRLSGPVHDLVRQMVERSLLTADTRPADEYPGPSPEILAAFGATPEQLDRLAAATEFVVVQADFRPGWPPAHEWATRSVALAMAESLDADLIDVPGRRLLSQAAALRSLPDPEGRIRLVDWITVSYSSSEAGLRFTTKGLRRFGLLELQTEAVPERLVRAWGAVMNGAARRLLRTWIDELDSDEVPAFIQLPIATTVTSHDIAMAHGQPQQHSVTGPAVLRLELDPATDPDADSFLTLRPPAGYPGPAGQYFASVCAELFEVDGARDDLPTDRSEIRYLRPDAAMARAVATARDTLPMIRERFLTEGLPDGTQLVVKYGLPVEAGHEFVWASVTSWATSERIVAASANDATSDPEIRVGSPVVVNTVDVIDWALLDGTGVIEGGWTQAVLDSG